MPTEKEAAEARAAYTDALADLLRGAGYQVAPTRPPGGLFVIDSDGWGYYLGIQSLAITDPKYQHMRAQRAAEIDSEGGGTGV